MASFQQYDTKQGKRWSLIADIGIDPTTGKRKQKKVRGFKTKKEAQLVASQIENDVSNGTYVKEKDMLFKDFVEDWLLMYSKDKKPSSVDKRQTQINNLLTYFSSTKLKNITKLMYQNAINDLFDKEYAYNTIVGIHSTGKLLFAKALELNVIKNNPSEKIKIPKRVSTVEDIESKKEDLKYLEKDELFHFLKIAKEKGLDHDYVFFSVLAYSGLRVGELIALTWNDLDFKENSISITKTMYNPQNKTDEYKLLTPKTKGSIRTLKMDNGIMQLLRTHKAQQNEWKLFTRSQYNDKGFIFALPNGSPTNYRTCNYRIKRLIQLSNIDKKITLHSLRHTHTSLLIESQVGIKEIQQRMGHTDINTTMNIYAHMTKNMEEKASAKFTEFMQEFTL